MGETAEPKSEQEVLAAVEVLAARRRSLVFPDWLNRRFEADTGMRYSQLLAGAVRRSTIYYNLFLAGPFLLTPDRAWLAAALHIFVVTPWMLLVAHLFRTRLTPLARDIAVASVPLMIGCQILCVFSLSHSATISHYLYFVALNAITFNTSLRLRYRAARWATWLTFLILIVTVAITQKIPLVVSIMHCFSFGVCGLVTLLGAADREREFRRSYLYGLRDRLKIAATDAEANQDALTGAVNRRGLDSAVRVVWSGEDPAAPVAVILFDVDRFKAYNDIYGHLAGDACLRRIAAAAREALRERGVRLARYGGEEFLVLLTGAQAQDAEAIADELRKVVLALNLVHAGAGERRVVSASFGVARGTVGETGFEALTAAADRALYGAKSAGRNRVNCALAA